MRHIHATTLLLACVPVHVVAARLGHADPSITLVYAHVIRSAEASAAGIFARSINDRDPMSAALLARSRDCPAKQEGPLQNVPGSGPFAYARPRGLEPLTF
nr:tyrosine-type recombinase/integrase [Microbispora sp. H13382]